MSTLKFKGQLAHRRVAQKLTNICVFTRGVSSFLKETLAPSSPCERCVWFTASSEGKKNTCRLSAARLLWVLQVCCEAAICWQSAMLVNHGDSAVHFWAHSPVLLQSSVSTPVITQHQMLIAFFSLVYLSNMRFFFSFTSTRGVAVFPICLSICTCYNNDLSDFNKNWWSGWEPVKFCCLHLEQCTEPSVGLNCSCVYAQFLIRGNLKNFTGHTLNHNQSKPA